MTKKKKGKSNLTNVERYENGCQGKEAYPTEASAQAYKEFQQRMGDRGANRLTPYECFFCKEWHLGHPTGVRKSGVSGKKRHW